VTKWGIVCDTICYQPIWHPTNLYRSHEDHVTASDPLIISKGLSFSLYWISHFTFSLHLLFQNPRRLSFGGAKRKIKCLCTQLAHHRQKRVSLSRSCFLKTYKHTHEGCLGSHSGPFLPRPLCPGILTISIDRFDSISRGSEGVPRSAFWSKFIQLRIETSE